MKYLTINIILISYIVLLTLGYLLGIKPLIIISGSMSPALATGDVIIVKKDQYRVNDIISFYSNKQLVTHRVVDLSDDWLQTKGDANKECDNRLINVNQVLGKVIFVLPIIGYLFYYLQSNSFIYLLILIIIILLFKKVKYAKK